MEGEYPIIRLKLLAHLRVTGVPVLLSNEGQDRVKRSQPLTRERVHVSCAGCSMMLVLFNLAIVLHCHGDKHRDLLLVLSFGPKKHKFVPNMLYAMPPPMSQNVTKRSNDVKVSRLPCHRSMRFHVT